MACNGQHGEQAKIRLKEKYKYLSWSEIDTCYDLALCDYLRHHYPSENNRPKADSFAPDFIVAGWIFARMVDIVSREGASNLEAYKENGISFTFASSYIDPVLLSQILPKAGVPK